jgi:glycosyltransferase involved in cell wall biosynthesis
VIYNGVDPERLLGISAEGADLIQRLDLLDSDLIMLMPVRVARSKNIELALEVLAALKTKDCRPKLVVTGPPSPNDAVNLAYYGSLLALRQELGVEAEAHFVYEAGPDPDREYCIDQKVVGDLYRVSDMLFMPSHREGFGMPVLEAGIAGLPVVCTAVPAATEIGGRDLIRVRANADPARVADTILNRLRRNAQYRLRRRVRHGYTWQSLFESRIEPLLRS